MRHDEMIDIPFSCNMKYILSDLDPSCPYPPI